MHKKTLFCWLCWLVASVVVVSLSQLSSARGESLPNGLQVIGMEARPAKIELQGAFSYRQLVLIGKLSTGEQVDLTRMAKIERQGDAAAITPEGNVRAVDNGECKLVATFEQQRVEIPVVVSGVDASSPVSFVRDVQPVLSKMGCNQGTCHGAKDGKGGFKLSLRGYDPLYDHRALTDDIGARRFNRAAPDQSLFLLKGTGSIPHVGGVRMNVGEPYYDVLRRWIAQGVKLDLETPRVAKIEIWPLDPILPRAGMQQQFTVTAHYSNGMQRDVTREAFVESGNIEVLEARPGGIIATLRRGEAPVLVRYEGAYAATNIIVMGDRSGFQWQSPPVNNFIDSLVYKKLERVKVLPSDLCDDAEFVRRLYLDLTGQPPTLEQTTAFLADGRDSRTKRESLIDQLVGSPAYVEFWTNKWADMLQVNRKFLGEEGAIALRNWIKDAVASNKPYDQFAREVLTAAGSTLDNPPAAYYKILREPEATMENTTHLFLAVRFNCNKCHDHPFERWTQDQYYHLAAYFAQIGRKEDANFAGQKIGGSAVEGAAPLVEVIYDSGSGEVTHNRTGKQSPPEFPYQADIAAANAKSRRAQLATWMTSPQNQYFARSYVNRLWGYLFGVGIIEPIDDIRAGNPPTNPELLDALAKEFIEHQFDVQHLVRQICKSRAYQHSLKTNQWNADDTLNYSHALPRRLPAEVLFDSIHLATGSVPQINGVPRGFRAAELPDAGVSDPFLDDFGRPVRESSCECERSSGMVLGPVMKLINGPTVSNAIADPNNALAKLVASQPDDRRVIEEVFLRFLARRPTAEEIELGVKAMNAVEEGPQAALEQLKAYEATLAAKQTAWEQSVSQPVTWTPLEFTEMKSAAGATFQRRDDGAIIVGGNRAKDVYTLQGAAKLAGVTGLKIETLTDDRLPTKGPGRADNGNFVLNELRAFVVRDKQEEPVKFTQAVADFSQASWAASGAIDGNDGTGWAVSPQMGQPHELVVATSAGVANKEDDVLRLTLTQQYADNMHLLGCFRISVTSSANPTGGQKLPDAIAAALAVPADKRSPEQSQAIAQYYRSQDAELARLQAEVVKGEERLKNRRLYGVQDIAWALINSPAFLFNR